MNWTELFEHAEEWTVSESELSDALAELRAERADE